MRTGTSRILLVAFLLLLGLAALRDFARLGDALPWRAMADFPDFFCAGDALDARASPYTYQPLHACEHRVNTGTTFRGRVFAANPSLAVPAPQPAYDFLPFMALARLPFPLARVIHATAILVAVILCAAALAGLGVPLSLAAAALLLSTAYAGLNTGQIVPFSLAALALCGFLLSRGRDSLAGVLAVGDGYRTNRRPAGSTGNAALRTSRARCVGDYRRRFCSGRVAAARTKRSRRLLYRRASGARSLGTLLPVSIQPHISRHVCRAWICRGARRRSRFLCSALSGRSVAGAAHAARSSRGASSSFLSRRSAP